MTKTKSVRPICAMRSGVTKQPSSVRADGLTRAPVGRQRATSFLDVRLVLVPEMLQGGHHRRDRGVAECAERLAGDIAADAGQQVEVGQLPFAALDFLQD